MFPDAPTLRGRKHLVTLMNLVEKDTGAGVLFSVQHPDTQEIDLTMKWTLNSPNFSMKRLKRASRFLQTLTFKPPNTIDLKPNSPRFSFT